MITPDITLTNTTSETTNSPATDAAGARRRPPFWRTPAGLRARFATSRGTLDTTADAAAAADAIYVAAGRGDLVAVRRLVDADPALVRAEHPVAGGTALDYAALTGQVDVMRYLIARGADPLSPDLVSLLARVNVR